MAEITKVDIQRAVQEAMRDIRSDVHTIKSDVAKVEQRTNDLDQSQVEIRRLVELAPKLDLLTKQMQGVASDVNRMDGLMDEIRQLKNQLQMTSDYLKQVAAYLQAMDQRHRDQSSQPSRH